MTVGELEVDPAARRARLAGEELELTRKEFDLLVELMRNEPAASVTREDLMPRSGTRTGSARPRRSTCTSAGCAASSATDPTEPRFVHTVRGVALPLQRSRGSSRVSLRIRLLLALAYVLLLAIVALGVPLALNLRDRVDAEVKSQARSQADVVAATAADLLATRAAGQPPPTSSTARRARSRGACWSSTPPAGCSPTAPATRSRGDTYSSRPEIAAALNGRAATRSPAAATR